MKRSLRDIGYAPLCAALGFALACFGWFAAAGRSFGHWADWIAIAGGAALAFVLVSRLRGATHRSERQRRDFEAVFAGNPQPMWIYDAKSQRIVAVNEAATRQYGYTEAEFVTMTPHDLRPEEDRARYMQYLQSSRFREGINRSRHRTKEGKVFFAEVRAWNTRFGGRESRLVISTDITERLKGEQTIRLADAAFNSAREAIVITTQRGALVAVNAAVCAMTGYAAGECVGRGTRFLRAPRGDRELRRVLHAALRESGHWQGEIRCRRKDASEFPVWLSISAVPNAKGQIRNYVGFATDLSAYKEATDRIHSLSHYDSLTLLPNRALLEQGFERLLASDANRMRELCVLFVDLDDIRRVNDSLGHAAGDAALRNAAAHLSRLASDVDAVARWSGDTFALVLRDTGPADALRIAESALKSLAAPSTFDDQPICMTASIGVSMFPKDGTDASTLLRNAGTAANHAKEHGGNCVRFFRPELDVAVRERHALESGLRLALVRDEFSIRYQPQVRLADSTTAGVEALLRWRSPELGSVPPDKFIPIAEAVGLMDDIGAWVLRNVCLQAAQWRREGLLTSRVAVNVSGAQLRAPAFVDVVRDALAAAELPAEALELEITESMVVEQSDEVHARLDELVRLGVSFAIDDFGTGYSSLGYLQSLPVQALKIHRSFVQDMLPDPRSRSVPQAVIAIGRSFGLRVVGEGVEKLEQHAALVLLGCDTAQGYLFAKPMTADETSSWMREREALLKRLWTDVPKAA